jgi:PKD repeat protein
MRSLCIIIISLVAVCSLHAQRQAENWYFGELAGMNVRTSPPVILTDGVMNTREGCITVSDTSGRLMFYSDGSDVWTKNHVKMPGGVGLWGFSSSTQSCIVIPWPGRPSRYFLVTVDAVERSYARGISYSVVDMTLNGGNGDVLLLNVPLAPGASEKITAVRHANGVDAWLIGHEVGTNTFLVYLVTRNGINATPATYRLGPAVQFGDIGYLRANPQGTRLAMATSMPGRLSMFRFDRATGAISTAITLSSQLTYGVEFSPDGTKLYASSYSNTSIDQYDCSVADASIAGTRMSIGRSGAVSNGALQLAPNGCIYLAHENSPTISEIARPNVRGVGCQYRDRNIDLGGRISRLGLPNMFPAVFSNETVYDIAVSDGCVGDTLAMRVTPVDSATSVQWDFGDPSSGSLNRSRTNPTSHVYRAAGSYTVKATFRSASGSTMEREVVVKIGARPAISAGPDITICKGQVIALNVLGSATFSWSPGNVLNDSTVAKPRATLTKTTTFIVTGRSAEGCESYDTITVVVNEGKVSTSPDTTICIGGMARLRASGASTYEWSPATGLDDARTASPRATPTVTTQYRVIGRSGSCIDTAFITVAVASQPTATIVPQDPQSCPGVPVVLTASGGERYQWLPSPDIADGTVARVTVAPRVTTTYTVVVTSRDGCSDTASVTVRVGGTITVTIPNDTTVCAGTEVTLTCSTPGNVQWIDRSTGLVMPGATVTITALQSTWIDVLVENDGCSGRDSMRLNVVQPPPLVISADTTICIGDTVVLSATGASRYAWTPSTNLAYNDRAVTRAWPDQTTLYRVQGWNDQGCVASANVTVTVVQPQSLQLRSENVVSQTGGVLRIPVSFATGGAVPGPLVVTLVAREDVVDLVVVSHPNVRRVTRTRNGADAVITVELSQAIAPPTILELDVRVLLTGSNDRAIAVRAEGTTSCTEPGEASIGIEALQCASSSRVVTIGPSGPRMLSAMPNEDQTLAIAWSSSAVGHHEVRIVGLQGTLLSTTAWSRNVRDPQTSTIILPTDALATGVYVVCLETAEGVLSVPVVIR